jgi:hypothetical protein
MKRISRRRTARARAADDGGPNCEDTDAATIRDGCLATNEPAHERDFGLRSARVDRTLERDPSLSPILIAEPEPD